MLRSLTCRFAFFLSFLGIIHVLCHRFRFILLRKFCVNNLVCHKTFMIGGSVTAFEKADRKCKSR